MYVAKRFIKDGGKTYKPGDEIPGFESWSVVAQRAHLNLEWVEKVQVLPTASTSPKETPSKKGKKK